jgi:hypothetical protein
MYKFEKVPGVLYSFMIKLVIFLFQEKEFGLAVPKAVQRVKIINMSLKF